LSKSESEINIESDIMLENIFPVETIGMNSLDDIESESVSENDVDTEYVINSVSDVDSVVVRAAEICLETKSLTNAESLRITP